MQTKKYSCEIMRVVHTSKEKFVVVLLRLRKKHKMTVYFLVFLPLAELPIANFYCLRHEWQSQSFHLLWRRNCKTSLCLDVNGRTHMKLSKHILVSLLFLTLYPVSTQPVKEEGVRRVPISSPPGLCWNYCPGDGLCSHPLTRQFQDLRSKEVTKNQHKSFRKKRLQNY